MMICRFLPNIPMRPDITALSPLAHGLLEILFLSGYGASRWLWDREAYLRYGDESYDFDATLAKLVEDGWVVEARRATPDLFVFTMEGAAAFFAALPADYVPSKRRRELHLALDYMTSVHRGLISGLLALRNGEELPPDGPWTPAQREKLSEYFSRPHPWGRIALADSRYEPLIRQFPLSFVRMRLDALIEEIDYHIGLWNFPREEWERLVNLPVLAEGKEIYRDYFLLHHTLLEGSTPIAELVRMSSEKNASGLMLRAVEALAAGKAGAAMKFCREALKLIAGRLSKFKIFPGVLENTIWGLALFEARDGVTARRQFEKFEGLRLAEMRDLTFPLSMFTQAALRPGKDFLTEANLPNGLDGIFLTRFLASGLSLNEFHETMLRYYLSQPGEMPPVAPFWARELRLRAGEETESDRLTGLPQLFKKNRSLPLWETTLNEALGIREEGAKKAAPETRIGYLIEWPGLRLRPILQERAGKKWKNKALDWETFFNGHPALSEADSGVVAAMTEKDVGYMRTELRIDYFAAMASLVGHPAIFDARNESLRIDIVEEPLTFEFRNDGFGWLLTNSLDEESLRPGEIVVRRLNEKLFVVTRVSIEEALFWQRLSAVDVFPDKAQEKLQRLCEEKGARIAINAPFLKNDLPEAFAEGDSRLTLFFEPVGAGFAATAAVCPMADTSMRVIPGEGLVYLGHASRGVKRDLAKEARHFEALEEKLRPLELFRTETYRWDLDWAAALEFLNLVFGDETVRVVWPEGERLRISHPTLTADRVHLSVSSLANWFKVEGNVVLDEKRRMTIAEILEKLREAKGDFIELGDKEFVKLTEELKRELKLLDAMSTKAGKKDVRVSAFHAAELDAMKEKGVALDGDDALKTLVARIDEADKLEPAVPAGLQADLRGYQVEGFEWMARLSHWGAGALLADDMGLGKTVQTIALLLSRASIGPAMVVLPTSVLHNWVAEIARFAPGLNVVTFNQSDRDRVLSDAKAGDVLLMTYGVLTSEIEKLAEKEWATVVLDEAHAIKNRATKTSRAVMQLKAGARLLLTGTPLQNNLSEIWNLLEFANPGLLGSFKDFQERFILPIEGRKDRERQRLLKRLISPFILRRTKSDVLDELPTKTTVTQKVELSADERALYEELRERASVSLETGEINTMEALAELTRLRQAACHPKLVNPKLRIASSKTAAFLELVRELIDNKHRALVFSQFTSHLALVREALDAAGIEYLYLDGGYSAAKRRELVENFKTGTMPLFLISLKAGGTGLNLTAADYVIHLDPWWNPAIEEQASDRAYRIGQERPVTIYRLIAKDTIEEKILKLHETKKQLADALLEGAEMGNRFSKDEILKLLAEE